MLSIVSTDLRIRLARAPFEAKYRPLLDRIQLLPYAELMADGLDLGASFLLCSVSSLTHWQRGAACLWESAATAAQPLIRIVNRPSQASRWDVLFENLRRQGLRAVETRSLREQLDSPRFPMVLRQQTPEFQLESPVIEDQRAIGEVVDRMVMAGGDPAEIRAVGAEALARGPLRVGTATLLRIGDQYFPSGEWRSPGWLAKMRSVAEALPLEAAALDFLIDDDGPCLWRIDDELCRILPHLVDSGGPISSTVPSVEMMDALAALSSPLAEPVVGSLEIDLERVKRIFRSETV